MRLSYLRISCAVIVLSLFSMPYATLFWHVGSLQWLQAGELWPAVVATMTQAIFSAFFSLALGLLGGCGLIWTAEKWGRKRQRVLDAVVLLPNIVPVIFLILAVMKLFPSLQGVQGIVFVHTIINIGLMSVFTSKLMRSKLSGMAELAWIEGASIRIFFLRGVIPALRHDLALMFLFVFTVCLTSFAVPLMLGGSQATTLEVLIYQHIRFDGDWSQALSLACLQAAIVLLLSWVLSHRDESYEPGLEPDDKSVPLLGWPGGLIFALLPTALLSVGMLTGLGTGFRYWMKLQTHLQSFWSLLGGSFVVSFGTGLVLILILFLIAYWNPQNRIRRLFVGYVAPSTVLTGFALLILWRTIGVATFVKMVLGLALIMVPSFYRLFWDAHLRSLQGQRDTAVLLGASQVLIFRKIVFPQLVQPAFWLGGVASLWAWGDFALSTVVAERDVTLALVVHSLMESYRLESATFLSWVLVAGGFLSCLIFVGVGHVLGAKSLPKLW